MDKLPLEKVIKKLFTALTNEKIFVAHNDTYQLVYVVNAIILFDKKKKVLIMKGLEPSISGLEVQRLIH